MRHPDIRTLDGKKFVLTDSSWSLRWIRFKELRNLAAPCACMSDPYLEAWCDSQAFKLAVMKKFVLIWTICNRGVLDLNKYESYQCCVHVQYHAVYWGPWCDTQAFELSVWNFVFFLLTNFVLGVCSICKTTIVCQCWVHLTCQIHCSLRLDATPNHSNLPWCKIFSFWIQNWVRLEPMRKPVRVTCMRCQIWCILRLDAIPIQLWEKIWTTYSPSSCKRFILIWAVRTIWAWTWSSFSWENGWFWGQNPIAEQWNMHRKNFRGSIRK